MRNAAHLIGEAEGEAAVQLREGGRQIELCERLANAVTAAHAEGHEAHRRAPDHLIQPLCVLRAILHQSDSKSEKENMQGGVLRARLRKVWG